MPLQLSNIYSGFFTIYFIWKSEGVTRGLFIPIGKRPLIILGKNPRRIEGQNFGGGICQIFMLAIMGLSINNPFDNYLIDLKPSEPENYSLRFSMLTSFKQESMKSINIHDNKKITQFFFNYHNIAATNP